MATDNRPFDVSALTAGDAAPALRSVAAHLRRAGFDAVRAAAAVGAPDPEHLLGNPARHSFFADRSRPGPRGAEVSVLTSLFVLNRHVPAEWVRAALAPELLDPLRDLALLREEGGEFHGRVSLTPYRSRYFLSDRLFASPRPQQVVADPGEDLVMPPHASSVLALETLDRVEGSFLDVGCGCGFLALNAGPKCGRVAGVDLNPRCVDYSTANAVLNDADARFAVADFAALADGATSPVGEDFGTLLFNSPTTPEVEATTGEFGQTTAERVLRLTAEVAPRLLRPGGTAYVLALVEVPRRFGSATDAVRHWLDDATGADVSVTEFDLPHLTITPRQLAERRLNGHSLLVYSAAHAQRLMSALAGRGVGSVGLAMVGIRPQEVAIP